MKQELFVELDRVDLEEAVKEWVQKHTKHEVAKVQIELTKTPEIITRVICVHPGSSIDDFKEVLTAKQIGAKVLDLFLQLDPEDADLLIRSITPVKVEDVMKTKT